METMPSSDTTNAIVTKIGVCLANGLRRADFEYSPYRTHGLYEINDICFDGSTYFALFSHFVSGFYSKRVNNIVIFTFNYNIAKKSKNESRNQNKQLLLIKFRNKQFCLQISKSYDGTMVHPVNVTIV